MRAITLAVMTLLLGAAIYVLYPPELAQAKSGYDSSYGFERTWNAGLRLVRVDMNMKVTEKDDAVGYLFFEYKSPEGGSKPVPGSMEFIRGKDGNVHVVVQIPQMPGYHEQVMVDSLARKLRNEYGDPPKKIPPTPEKAKDAGADAAASDAPATDSAE